MVQMKTIFNRIGIITGIIFLMGTSIIWGQKRTKTFHENFNVSGDVVLEVNTSYADIEFETWNRNQVDIVAVVELEDVSEEEASNFFKKEPVKIVGNSKSISISTALGHREFTTYNTKDIDINIDFLEQFNRVGEAYNIAPLVELPELPEVMELPPLPPMNIQPFDYEAYKKDGEAYLKEWKKEFDKGFGKDYEIKMEEWSKRMDLKRAEIDKKRIEMEKNREQAHQDRLEKLQEIQSQRMKVHENAQEQLAKSITSSKHVREMAKDNKTITIKIDTVGGMDKEFVFIEERHPTAPNVFYSIRKGRIKI